MYCGQISLNLNFLVVRVFVRRKPSEKLNDEYVVSTVKHDGGSLWCGDVLCERAGDWIHIKGIVKKRTVLFNYAKTCYIIWFTHKWKKITFQQDNEPKHPSK